LSDHAITITAEQAQELARLAAAEVLAKRPLLAPSLPSGTVRAPGAQAYAQRLRQLAILLQHQLSTML